MWSGGREVALDATGGSCSVRVYGRRIASASNFSSSPSNDSIFTDTHVDGQSSHSVQI